MPDTMATTAIPALEWGSYPVPSGSEVTRHRFGTTTMHISQGRPVPGEPELPVMKVAITYGPDDGSVEPVWSFLVPARMDHSYIIRPVYPSDPVCIRIDTPLSLARDATLEGWFTSIIDLELVTGGLAVTTYPLEPPFRTLFGSPDKGLVCRFGNAAFEFQESAAKASIRGCQARVLHPVRLRNSSDDKITVQDLVLYGEQLSAFWTGTHLQSETVAFTFGDSGVRMSVDSQGKRPADWTTLATPRVSSEELALGRSIQLLKSITGM